MRSLSLAVVAALSLSSSAAAQERDTRTDSRGLPRDVAREATRLFNETKQLRATGRLEIEQDRVVEGDVAVLDGPLLIAGRVKGRVLAINSDVILRPTARIDGDLLVVGGEVEGRHVAYVGGETRIYRQQLRYTQEGELLVADRVTASEETGWWRRWERTQRRSGGKLQIASAGAYNRVEGLPINLGPQLFQNFDWGSVRLDAYAVLRTETSFEGTRDDVGHNVSLETKLGRRGGVLLGGRMFNVIEPVESWQLKNIEAGLAAFLLRRDYRDYYERRGAQGRAGFFLRRGADITVSYGVERWGKRSTENPWTLLHQGHGWRVNPAYDAGLAHLINTTLRVDTRNDTESPWSGWFVVADVEHGFSDITEYAPVAPPLAQRTPGRADYARGFMDLRRYNRVSPESQLNFRVVLGGWLNGDALPLQRRFSVDGPGAIPGYDFRSPSSGNSLTCTDGTVPGMPSQCDRMALGQVEYRGDLHFNLFTDWDDEDDYMRRHADGVWVVFADAGRGWLVGQPDGALTYGRKDLPPLSTFRTDLGVGLDFDIIGVFVAKAMSRPKEPANFLVRIRHRF